MSLASCSTSSGLMPAAPKNVTGSSLVTKPWWDMVSIRTVVPDFMRSTGGTRADIYPQTTVSGVEPKVTSGLLPPGAGCDAAGNARASAPAAAQLSSGHLETCFAIDRTFPSGVAAKYKE